jgi:hypothetical protein
MRQFANLLLWLVLTAEIEGYTFYGKWTTPLTTVGTFLFRTLFQIVPWDVLVVAAILAAQHRRKGLSKPLLRSMLICVGAVAGAWLWGVLRGGSAYQSYYQLHSFAMGLAVALMVMLVYRTTADIRSLGRIIAFAAAYRAVTLIVFYFVVAKDLPEEMATLTDHADTVTFVVGFFIPLVNWMLRRTPGSLLIALGMIILMGIAIVLNNRRIAWLGVGVGVLIFYVLLPPGPLRRKVNRWLLLFSPLIVGYIAAGWGSKAPIFKPVASISSMFGENQDTSSMMRDIENYNLLVSLKTNPLLGMGWGWEYIEQVRAIDISGGFPQYRYLPHNSLLGVVAFSGMVWFAGFWQLFTVTAFLHARAWLDAKSIVVRAAAVNAIIALTIVVIEMWGDVGFNHMLVQTTLGVVVGLASRLPALAERDQPAQTLGST